jgi:periplasmic protein CpxP/Spy
MLKRCLLTLMFAALLYTVASPALAQDNGGDQQAPAAAPPDHGGRRGAMDPQKRVEMLTKQLNLTSDQQAKALEILKTQQSQMDALRSDTSTPPQDKRSKMMDIHKTSNDQIRALLDPDQQKKWDVMQNRHGQWQGHRPDDQAPSDNHMQ